MLNVSSGLLLERVVGGAHQRARFDVRETHLLAKRLVLGEFVRMNEAHDGEVFARGLHVLSQR